MNEQANPEAGPDPRQVAVDLLRSMGNPQPHPSETKWLSVNTSIGQRFIVMVITDITGRRAVWFDDAGLRKHITDAQAVLDEAADTPTPLQVAHTMPQGVPLPGAPLIPPGMRT